MVTDELRVLLSYQVHLRLNPWSKTLQLLYRRLRLEHWLEAAVRLCGEQQTSASSPLQSPVPLPDKITKIKVFRQNLKLLPATNDSVAINLNLSWV